MMSPPLLEVDNVRARAKAWGEVLRDVMLWHTKEVTAPQVELI